MAKQQAKPTSDTVYLVNPAGAVHSVSREHARSRLRQIGWRIASSTEVQAYKAQKVQRHDNPIAARWTPEPPAEPEIDGEA